MIYIKYCDYFIGSIAMVSQDYYDNIGDIVGVFNADDFYQIYEEFTLSIPKHKIPVIICKPMNEAILTCIEPSLDSLQRIVGGNIEIISLPQYPDVDIVCNEEGKVNKLRLNRAIYHKGDIVDIVAGNMIIMGVDIEGNYHAMDIKTIEKIYYDFLTPEVFVIDDNTGKVSAIKCMPEIARLLRENNISIIGQKKI